MGKTKYRILVEGEEEVWHLCYTDIEATSSVAAIRAAVAGEGGSAGGTYVAIPTRSFKPQPVEVETKHRLKIG